MRKRPGRHRARNFARAVDGSGSPHPSVYRLVSLASALRKTPLRSMAPHDDVRQRLLAEAATTRPTERRPFWVALWEDCLDQIKLQRGLASTTVLCTVLIAVAGIGFGTTESLPGDTLYSMKLRSESVQLAFIGSDEQRGKKNLQFADSRLDEIARLLRHKGDWPTTPESNKPDTEAVEDLINRTFNTMDASTAAGATAMRKAFEKTGDVGPLTHLDEFADEQQRKLRELMPSLPNGSKAPASDSLALVGELDEETERILGTDCDESATCSEGSETSAASNPTTPPGTPTSGASTDASSPTATDTDGSTSAEPPTNSSSGETSTGSGTSTSQEPSGTDSGSSTGSGTSTSSPSPTEESGTESSEPSQSPSPSSSPTATPPEPTGVPSDPDGTTTKSDTASDSEGSTAGDGDRHSAPPAEDSRQPESSETTTDDGADADEQPATDGSEASQDDNAESTTG